MGDPPQTGSRRPFKRIDYLYKEYVRLNQSVDADIESSFGEIKLFAALASFFPIISSGIALYAGAKLSISEEKITLLLFFSFLFLLGVAAIVAFRDLMRSSIIRYKMEHLRQYERALRHLLSLEETNTFEFHTRAADWNRSQHVPIVLLFEGVFLLAVGGIPTFVLAQVQPPQGTNFALLYALICGALFLLNLTGALLLLKFRMP